MNCFQKLANFVLVLVVLALLGLAALNFLLMPRIDAELADSVRREFLLPPSSTVLIGRGSLLDTLEGQVDNFYVSSPEAKLDGMLVEDLEFRASGIRFDTAQVLLSGNAGLKDVQSGELSLRISEQALIKRWGGELAHKGLSDAEITLTSGRVDIAGTFDMGFAAVRIGAAGRIVADGGSSLRLEVDELQLGGADIDVKMLKAAFSALTPVVDLERFRVAIEVDELRMEDGYLLIKARSHSLEGLGEDAARAGSELDRREQELLDELERVRREKEAQDGGGEEVQENPGPEYIPDDTPPDEKDMNSLGGEA